MTDLSVKARVQLRNSLVEIEGSPEAVCRAIQNFEASALASNSRKNSLKAALESLVREGFFSRRHPRTMSEIKEELGNRRVFYSASSLFPVLYKEFLKTGRIVHSGTRGSFTYHSKHGQEDGKK